VNEARINQAADSESSIRSQLIWAALFPLVFFGLLSTLVTTAALHEMTLNLVFQRNTAQVQLAADLLKYEPADRFPVTSDVLNLILETLNPINDSHLYLINTKGNLIASSITSLKTVPLDPEKLSLLIQQNKATSQLMVSAITSDEVVVSFAPLPREQLGIVLEEPWTKIMAQANYYQFVLVGLLALGTVLSLGMLSVSIGRVIRPIAKLAQNAAEALPGSVFHPVSEQGPRELRILIKAFNQMVIRLAEQQSALRQYAHKAMLSQEEERQRLSHELHDGTVQDLVGLSQRIELCRTELEHNPVLALRRLDEIHDLVGKTMGNVRRISNALRPPVLEDLGLPIAVRSLCDDLVVHKPNITYQFNISGTPRRLQPEIELAVYRVVQESLANIQKHVQDATQILVELAFNETEIRAKIKNNGAVFANPDVRSLVRSGHLGLAGMYERARLFGGVLTITSDADENTITLLQIPCL
jgi:signal transduction histidine kinase